MLIPKITHQIWIQGFENIPEKFKKNINALHELNADYKHKQWDEDSLRKECSNYSKECLERFDSFDTMIMKVDFGRYVVLYNYGGVSVDTDMVQIRSIGNTPGIDTESFIISRQAFPLGFIGYLNNAIIFSTPKNEILKTIIDTIINDTRKCSDFTLKEVCVDWITGPTFITKILNTMNKPFMILDNKYYEPCVSLDIMCKIDKDAIMDHKHESSWVSSYLIYLGIIFIFIIKNIVYIIIIFSLLYLYIKYSKSISFFKKRHRINK